MKMNSIKQLIFPFFGLILLLFTGCIGKSDENNEINDVNDGGVVIEAPSLSIETGDGKNILTLTHATGTTATTYNIYWSDSPNVTTATGTKLSGVTITSPFTHNLTNGTLIYYIATAVVNGKESSASAMVGGMPGKWTELNPTNSPPIRDSHTAVYDSITDKMIIFGGKNNNTILQDLWILSDASKGSPIWSKSINSNPPSNRYGQTAVYNNDSRKMIVFGGIGGSGHLNDLYSLHNADNPATSFWQILTPANSPPSPRQGHAAAYDQNQDIMVVFGGAQQGFNLFNDVYILKNATSGDASWISVTTTGGPSPRCCMASAYDEKNHRMIIFGGFSGLSNLNDLWTLSFPDDFSSATWQELTPSGGVPISGRCCGVSLWDGNKFLLFGGGSFNSSSDDKIYAISLQSSTFTANAGHAGGPSARNFPTAVPAGIFLLFGGNKDFSPLDELWRLD